MDLNKNSTQQTVNQLNARYAMLNLQVLNIIKAKGLTRKDVKLIWSFQHSDHPTVILHFEKGNYPDEQLKF